MSSPQDDLLELVDGSETGTVRPAGRHVVGVGPRTSPMDTSGVSTISTTGGRQVQATLLPRPPSAASSRGSRGSSLNSADDLASYAAVLGVSGQPASSEGGNHQLAVHRSGVHPAGDDDVMSSENTAAPDAAARKNRWSSLCVFVSGSVFFLTVIAVVTFLSAFMTESFITESDRQSSASTAQSGSMNQRLQLGFLASTITSFNAPVTEVARTVNATAMTAAAGNHSPAIVGATVLARSGFVAKATAAIAGFCATNQLSDPSTCPPGVALTSTVLTALADPSNASTARAAYHQTATQIILPVTPLMLAGIAADVEAYDEAYFGPRQPLPSPSPILRGYLRPRGGITVNDLPTDFSRFADNATAAALPITSVHTALDPVAFGTSNAAPSTVSVLQTSPTAALQRVYGRESPVSLAIFYGHNGIIVDRASHALRSVRIDNVSTADGQPAIVVTTAGLPLSLYIATLNPPPYSRSCVVLAGVGGLHHEIISCLATSEPEEAENSVFAADATQLDRRLLDLLAKARDAREAKNNGTVVYVDQYQKGAVRLGRPTHIVSFAYISSAAAEPHHDEHRHELLPFELWMLTIELKSSTVIVSQNVPLRVGLIIFAIIALVTVVYLVAIYLAFVRPLSVMRRRMAQVARLDFALVPDDEPTTQSFDLSSSSSDEDAAGDPDASLEKSRRARRAKKNEEARLQKWQRRREALFPTTRILEVRLLFEDFFHVASALRSVVPFLPEAYRRQGDANDDSNDDPMFLRSRASDLDGSHALRDRPSSSHHGGDTTDDDDSISTSPTRLSSLSEIDLSEFRHHASVHAGSGISTGSNSNLSPTGSQRHGSNNVSGVHDDAAPVSPGTASIIITHAPRQSNATTPTHLASASTMALPPIRRNHHGGSAHNHSHSHSQSTLNVSGRTGGAAAASLTTSTNPLKVSTKSSSQLHGASAGVPSPHALPTIPDKAKHRYSNETQNRTVIVGYFSLYLRRAARQAHDVAADLQKEFIAAAISFSSTRKGQVSALAPHHLVAVWSGANAETKACSAALDYCTHLKKWAQVRGVADAYRTSVGLAHGLATIGVLGTTSKKFFVCDGPSVSRAAIMASTGIHNHASVVTTANVHEQLKMFATLRPVEQVAFPRALRKERHQQVETAYQCLYLDDNEDDQEWMYRLEQKGATGATTADTDGSPLAAQGSTAFADLPSHLAHLGPLPPRSDKSEAAAYLRGYAAWCQGHLVLARREFNAALNIARNAGHDDQCLTRRVTLLDEMAEKVPDFAQRYATPATSGKRLSVDLSSSGSTTQESFYGLSHHQTVAQIQNVTEATISGVAGASGTIHTHDSGSSAAGNLPSHIRRAVEFFDAVLRGRPYARMAAQLGVETFHFEA